MGFFDLQVNGYAGVDFCSAELHGEEVRKACDALRRDGIEEILATVITDTVPALEAKLKNLVRFREQDPVIAEVIRGFHVEGPFLNPSEGYIGAHPPEAVVGANVDDAKRLLEAGSGLVRLMTLAPECDDELRTTAFLAESGVTVSAGHCDPDWNTLERAVEAGLCMVTHLGNGCPVVLARHDNFIQRALSFSDRLWICFIPDGIHVPWFALRNYLKVVDLDRTIMTTDAIAAAGLGAGSYELSGFTVEVDESGAARRPGSPNLAGSTVTGKKVAENLARELGWGSETIEQVFGANPRSACLGLG